MFTFNQGTNPIANADITLNTPTTGTLDSVRVGGASPGNVSPVDNAEKDFTLTWPGGLNGVVSDPLGELTSHVTGDTIVSGDTVTIAGGTEGMDSVWFVDIDLTGVATPATVEVDLDASAATGGIFFESIAFNPVYSCDTDGDGTPNINDTDSDNDGITDGVEDLDPLADPFDAASTTVQLAPNLATSSDTGVSNTDNITPRRLLTFDGTCVPGATVEMFVDGVATGSTAVCTVAGEFSIPLTSPISTGVHNITYMQSDGAGTSTLSPVSYTHLTLPTTPYV